MKVPLDLVLVWFWWFGGAGSGEQEVGYGGGSFGDWDFSRFSFECIGSFGVWELRVAEAGSGQEVLGFEFGSVMRR